MSCTKCPTISKNTCSALDAGGLLFAALISSLLKKQCAINDASLYPPDAGKNLKQSYDFIVVGGGTAGCTVASRLSENANWNVLLIEAGGNPPFTSEVPGLAKLLGSPDSHYNWNYTTVPQTKSCRGSVRAQCPFPLGKMLGGCSSHNGMAYQRGRRFDYDYWRSLGNVGWSYTDVLPYFLKSEDMRASEVLSLPNANMYHRTGGPLTVSSSMSYMPLMRNIMLGANQYGYGTVIDFNRDLPLGFGLHQTTTRNGERCSTVKAFLTPAKNRKNLHVLKNALVTKIIIDSKSKVTTGVHVTVNGSSRKINALKEVIVSAGTLNSPKLLMLSGIGPQKHLSDLKVSPLISNLKVGNNLRDHVTYYGLILCFPRSEANNFISDFDDATYEYLKRRRGPLAAVGFDDFVGHISTNVAVPTANYPDIQIVYYLLNNGSDSVDPFVTSLNLNAEVTAGLKRLANVYDLVIPTIALFRPQSSGTVRLKSRNTADKPMIDPRYLSDENDVNALLTAISINADMSRRIPGIVNVTDIPLAACRDATPMTPAYWKCSMQYTTTTAYHPIGTCSMGTSAEEAVVDPQLRVYGVKKLRVVDASVMPAPVSANTYAPTVMIAEKASDLIKQLWNNS